MDMTQAVTVVLTEAEARDFAMEVHELDCLLDQAPGARGNTRTGMATIRKIRDGLVVRGLGPATTVAS